MSGNLIGAENLRGAVGGRWLQRPADDAGIDGVCIDSRDDLRGRVFFAIRGPRHDGHDHLAAAAAGGAVVAVVERTPAAPLPPSCGVLLVPGTRRALGRLAHVHRRTLAATRVVAITGSAGKTTTKALIDAALRPALRGRAALKSFNNDIGVPLTILSARPGDQYLLVEVGTNAPGEVAALGAITEPDVAVITLAGRSHLAGLGSAEAVAREKLALAACVRRGGAAIVNADCPLLRPVGRATANVVLYGEAPDAHLRLTARGAAGDRWWLEVNGRQRFEIGLPGRHNALNALAAIAVGRRLGVDDDVLRAGLAAATPPPMRMAVEQTGGLTICNDAYNANPESMAAALETFAEIAAAAPRRVLILGEMLELGADGRGLHEELGRRIVELDARAPIAHVVLVGGLMAPAAELLRDAWGAERVTRIPRLGPAGCARIAGLLRPDDAVLLKGSRGVGIERVLDSIGAGRPDPRTQKRRQSRSRAAAAAGAPGGARR